MTRMLNRMLNQFSPCVCVCVRVIVFVTNYDATVLGGMMIDSGKVLGVHIPPK